MDRLTANLASIPKSVKDDNGKEWLVAPVVMIVPGVLTSNHGAVLYNEENLSANPTIWNGTPLIENHPKVGNNFVSIHSDKSFENLAYGEIRSTTFNEKLTAEAWIDVAKAEKVAAHTLGKVRRGEPIEVSTGVKSKRTPQIGTYKSVAYTAVASDFVPDHLATLTNTFGACSISDGCGMNVNERKIVVDELLKALKLDMIRRSVPDDIIANELSHWQIQIELNEALGSKFTQDEPYAYVDDVYENFFIFTQNGDQFKLSYKKTDTGVIIGDETPVEVVRKTEFVPVSETTSNSDSKGEIQTMCKKTSIATLIANGSFKAGDEKILESFDEGRLAEMVVTSNQAKTERAIAEAILAGKPIPNSQTVVPATVTSNTTTPVVAPTMTGEQWLALAPPGYREAMEEAVQWRNQQKSSLTDQLTAHVADPNMKTALKTSLMLKELPELRMMQHMIPQNSNSHQQNSVPRVSFFGQPGIPSVHQNQQIDDSDILETPRIKWSEIAKAN